MYLPSTMCVIRTVTANNKIKYFLATIFRKYNFLLNCSYNMLFMKVAKLHLIISDIINTWCGLKNSDIWDSSRMTKSGCGWGHRMINCANNIWLKSDDKLEKASIIISAASWFLTRLEIIKPYYTLLLGTGNILQSMFIYQKDFLNDVYNCLN
jgi:hypothetical protein